MSELTPLLIGLVGTIIGAAPMVLVALINRGKTNAEGSSILSAAYVGLVKPQAEVIDRLKLELAEQTKQANEWQRKYNKSNSCAHKATAHFVAAKAVAKDFSNCSCSAWSRPCLFLKIAKRAQKRCARSDSPPKAAVKSSH